MLPRFVLGHDAVKDIRPVETGDEAARLLQLQTLGNIALGAFIGGCRQRHTWYMGKQLGQLPQLQVLGTEVMPPLRHTVRLINGEQRYLQTLQKIQSTRLEQTFGGQIEKVQLTPAQLCGNLSLLIIAERRIQRGCLETQLVQGGDLIIHQRNQGRNHHSHTVTQQPGHLIAQGLAAAGGHQYQRITALCHRLYDVGLLTAEFGITKHRLESLQSLLAHGSPLFENDSGQNGEKLYQHRPPGPGTTAEIPRDFGK